MPTTLRIAAALALLSIAQTSALAQPISDALRPGSSTAALGSAPKPQRWMSLVAGLIVVAQIALRRFLPAEDFTND